MAVVVATVAEARRVLRTRPVKRKHPDWYRDDLARLQALLAAGRLKPDRGPPSLEVAVIAHGSLEQAEVHGTLVLTLNTPDLDGHVRRRRRMSLPRAGDPAC